MAIKKKKTNSLETAEIVINNRDLKVIILYYNKNSIDSIELFERKFCNLHYKYIHNKIKKKLI